MKEDEDFAIDPGICYKIPLCRTTKQPLTTKTAMITDCKIKETNTWYCKSNTVQIRQILTLEHQGKKKNVVSLGLGTARTGWCVSEGQNYSSQYWVFFCES